MNKIIRYHYPHKIEGKHSSPRDHYFIYRRFQSKKKKIIIIFMIIYKHKARREVSRSQNISSVKKIRYLLCKRNLFS